MIRIFGGPRQYIQGPGAIALLGGIAQRRAARPVIIIDADVRGMLESGIVDSFGSPPVILECSGEITIPSITSLAARARADLSGNEPVLVFGIGGGKALDMAKAIASRLNADFVCVPTIASSDSPTGRAIAIYDDCHALVRIEYTQSSPEAVVVDTAVIAGAPPRFLRAGIGDAIATKFECERAQRDGSTNFFGTRALISAQVIADACYQTLRRHGAAAMQAAADHAVTPDLEATVEAAILMSGIGWESGGVSLAHAVVRGIGRSPGAKATLHGEHVAYGLLVQLAIEHRSDAFIIDLIAFYRQIDQACSLTGLGLTSIDSDSIVRIARWAADGPAGGNVIVSASGAEVCDAIIRIEHLAAAQ